MQIDQLAKPAHSIEEAIFSYRPNLVRLSAKLTGDAEVAEDLAQEALIEAWRHLSALRNPDALGSWLQGIAYNVYRRWQRRYLPEQEQLAFHKGDRPDGEAAAELSDSFDLEAELERDELSALLDRSLSLLPADSREVLVRRYLADEPLAPIAARLGISENAVAVKLFRGKKALAQLLTTTFRDEAAAYGIVRSADEWQQTRIWCFYCGQQRLLGRLRRNGDSVLFQLRCPDWCAGPGVFVSYSDGTFFSELLQEVKGFKPALSRIMGRINSYYRAGEGIRPVVPCIGCGQPATVVHNLPSQLPPHSRESFGLHVRCGRCRTLVPPHEGLIGSTFCLPQSRAFWKRHHRLKARPVRELTSDGQAALLVGFESPGDGALLEVLLSRDTFRLLRVTETRV